MQSGCSGRAGCVYSLVKPEKASDKDKAKALELKEIYKTVKNNLKRIDSQEIMIEGILNEEYDDWYSDDDEEFYYEDNSGISDMLAEACDFVHTCIDMEKYKEGYELLHCDLKRVILDTAYCAYYAVP